MCKNSCFRRKTETAYTPIYAPKSQITPESKLTSRYLSLHKQVQNYFKAHASQSLSYTPLLTKLNPDFVPYLYQLKAPHSDQVIYLLGTDHSIPLLSYPEIVPQIAEKSQVLITEVGYSNNPYRRFGNLEWLKRDTLTQLSLYRESGFKWLSYLHPSELKALEELVSPFLKMTWSSDLDQFHPALIELLLNKTLFSFLQGEGGDSEIIESFAVSSRPIMALETEEDRWNADDILNQVSQETCLIQNYNYRRFSQSLNIFTKTHDQTVDNLNLGAKQLLSYAKGDLDAFLPLASKRDIIYRNKRWFPMLKGGLAYNSDKVVLIMVGVAHLPGDFGLLKYFSRQGYEIVQMGK